jgi:hypothetical protein
MNINPSDIEMVDAQREDGKMTFEDSYVIGTVSQVAQSVQCLAMGWKTRQSRFDPRQRQKDSSSSLCVQTGSGGHLASYTMGIGGPFSGAKVRPGHDADHSPHQMLRSRMSRSYTSSPPSAFMAHSVTAYYMTGTDLMVYHDVDDHREIGLESVD